MDIIGPPLNDEDLAASAFSTARPFASFVELIAVKPRRLFGAASFPNARLQVLARVYLE